MNIKLSVSLCSLTLATALVVTTAPADAAPLPSKITSVRAVPGPGVGQVTISWKQDGRNTSGYKIETGLTTFSKTSSSLPKTGRNAKVFAVGKGRRSVTLSAAQVSAAGAPATSGNHLNFRLYAVNGSATRAYPYLQAVLPKPAPPKPSGTPIRLGTFNVRTAKATTDARPWLRRAPDVAREIRDHNPGLVALQELGPGRADGKVGTTNGTTRHTTSLAIALRSVGAGKYRLTRETSYVKPGTVFGTQGSRILYDTSRYTLLSRCTDKTGKSSWSPTCGMILPLLPGDKKSEQRAAAYARFQDKRTGKRIWFASVHLDARHSSNLATEKRYNSLRGSQMRTVYNKLRSVNTSGDQVIIAGDINSWQNNRAGNAPHDFLVAKGFTDTSAAQTRINTQYTTSNHFDTVLKPAGQGFGVRLDVIMVQGRYGAKRFENVMKRVDSTRPSDHNLVISDVVI